MITSLSTQGGRPNPQTMGASGPSPIVALWSRGSAAVSVFNPAWISPVQIFGLTQPPNPVNA